MSGAFKLGLGFVVYTAVSVEKVRECDRIIYRLYSVITLVKTALLSGDVGW